MPLEQLTVPLALRRLEATVHHATHFNVPYASRVPIVLTVYDLIMFLDPSKARSRAAGAYYRSAFPLAVRRASIVVAVSTFTAKQLTEAFGIKGERLRIIEPGLDHERWRPRPPDETAAVRSRFGLPSEFLLYVGTAKPHKNLATLLAAHRADHPPLVLVGPTSAELTSSGAVTRHDGRLLALGRVPDDALPGLYSAASALVLPSLYEGVGLPPLEAMACGTPVVVSDGGALPETVGDAGLVVPALDTDAWNMALSRITGDSELRAKLARAGLHHVANRNWCNTARQYLDVYREAAAA
jgi:alpha-1,3-rhamnosyl/mannosyltransferase